MSVEAQIVVGQRVRLPERLREMDSLLLGWKVRGTGGEDLNLLLREAAREIERLRLSNSPTKDTE